MHNMHVKFEPRSRFNSRLQSLIVRVNVVLDALFSIARSVACVAAGPRGCILLYSIHVYTEGLERL